MKFDKIFMAFPIKRIGKTTKSSKVKKTTIRFLLFSSTAFIILLTTQLPLKGEVDYLTQMGVIKLDKMIEAPGFILPDLEGRKRSLSDFQGKFVMLNFWATW
jgi:hypothetical protein